MKYFISLVIIIAVAVGVYFWSGDGAEQTPGETSNNSATTTSETAGTVQGEVKEFAVVGTNFTFSVKEMRVKKGDRVRVIFTNNDGKHDWKLDEFGVATKILDAGMSETVEFVADKAGTFEYYCSVGTHRQMGMKGNLIVEE